MLNFYAIISFYGPYKTLKREACDDRRKCPFNFNDVHFAGLEVYHVFNMKLMWYISNNIGISDVKIEFQRYNSQPNNDGRYTTEIQINLVPTEFPHIINVTLYDNLDVHPDESAIEDYSSNSMLFFALSLFIFALMGIIIFCRKCVRCYIPNEEVTYNVEENVKAESGLKSTFDSAFSIESSEPHLPDVSQPPGGSVPNLYRNVDAASIPSRECMTSPDTPTYMDTTETPASVDASNHISFIYNNDASSEQSQCEHTTIPLTSIVDNGINTTYALSLADDCSQRIELPLETQTIILSKELSNILPHTLNSLPQHILSDSAISLDSLENNDINQCTTYI